MKLKKKLSIYHLKTLALKKVKINTRHDTRKCDLIIFLFNDWRLTELYLYFNNSSIIFDISSKPSFVL